MLIDAVDEIFRHVKRRKVMDPDAIFYSTIAAFIRLRKCRPVTLQA